MQRKRGRPSNADRAASRTIHGNAGDGDKIGGSIRIDPPAPAAVQADVKPECVDIAAANPGFTAAVEGPQETGPNATIEPTTGAEIKRGPGRPRGATRKPISTSGVETLLLGIHSTLHAVFKADELAMDKEEARLLAQSYSDVAEFYPMMNFDPKYAALANFAGTIALVYGAKLTAFRLRKMMQGPRGQIVPRPQAQQRQQQNPIPENSFVSPNINGVDPGAINEKRDVPREARMSRIEGVGDIEFPPDHPLVSGKPN